jgi:hypothetical protein
VARTAAAIRAARMVHLLHRLPRQHLLAVSKHA